MLFSVSQITVSVLKTESRFVLQLTPASWCKLTFMRLFTLSGSSLTKNPRSCFDARRPLCPRLNSILFSELTFFFCHTVCCLSVLLYPSLFCQVPPLSDAGPLRHASYRDPPPSHSAPYRKTGAWTVWKGHVRVSIIHTLLALKVYCCISTVFSLQLSLQSDTEIQL